MSEAGTDSSLLRAGLRRLVCGDLRDALLLRRLGGTPDLGFYLRASERELQRCIGRIEHLSQRIIAEDAGSRAVLNQNMFVLSSHTAE